ncbi:GNAT family N-acetyltransferase [Prevotella sp. PINT]|uniref:GNAT family N-acetyltransferase n=1 Tax=Palleniella intestinalis TaxID=2736291 RepID=UPI001555389C|nr:GNAT family N-acetyltransferase [Palleniella intestinalis]NPD82253.1 GNAT family N-acetyltransferase [Palleniella intestinalis]
MNKTIFRPICDNKKKYMELLLLADEQESMIDRYLDRGDMWVLEDNGLKAACVVTDEGNGTLEIKNLAVVPEQQRHGYGKRMIEFIAKQYNSHKLLRVGTGDSPLTMPFYLSCGFTETYRIKDFFTDNYNHTIIEAGVVLKDMVVFERQINKK